MVPFLEQAGASGATAIGLANGHVDLVDALKAAKRIGDRPLPIVGLLTFIGDIHAAGLPTARGLIHADSWY